MSINQILLFIINIFDEKLKVVYPINFLIILQTMP